MNDYTLPNQTDEELFLIQREFEEAERVASIERFSWGTFQAKGHIYRDKKGAWLPSTTQIIKEQGLGVDFSMIDPEWLLWKSAIGTRVHRLSDIHDLRGSVDPSELNIDTDGYLESWISFKRISGFVAQRVSFRQIANINGMLYGMELDKEGMLGKYPCILDLKCSMMNPPAWGYQTASYEMGVYSSSRCGRVIRGAVQLFKDGTPGRLLEHTNHLNDAQQFLSALCNIHERIRIGNLKEPSK